MEIEDMEVEIIDLNIALEIQKTKWRITKPDGNIDIIYGDDIWQYIFDQVGDYIIADADTGEFVVDTVRESLFKLVREP